MTDSLPYSPPELGEHGSPDPRADMLDRVFDAQWYLENNLDIKKLGIDPREHYAQHGYKERRSPHPLFDLEWYLNRHPDVAQAGLEPISHYFTTGWRQLHSPHPMFDPAWYLQKNLDLVAADLDPVKHYIDHGWKEGRRLHPLFDPAWYLEQNPDVAELDTDPLCHFLTWGWRENRRPHPLFDIEWYLASYSDIEAAVINPWLHYITSGWVEGRSPHPEFDGPWYQATWLDPEKPICEPLAHYLDTGWREGLRPSAGAPEHPVSGARAPLLDKVCKELSGSCRLDAVDLTDAQSRGTLVMVVHETEVGGAPHVVHQFAQWVRDHSRFGVRFVALNGGNLRHAFAKTAPLLVLSDLPEDARAAALVDWLGDDTRGVFVNSIVSGGILRYLPQDVPTLAFIHELPKVLDLYPEETALVRDKVQRVVGGGPEVTNALRTRYGFDRERLVCAHSFIEDLPAEVDQSARRAAARAALGVPDLRVLVMGCGLLHWRKSPETFVAVAETVLARGIDAEFVWLGGGPDQEACDALVAEKGLKGRVRFTGYEPAVADKLAGGDIFVLSSQEDPFPLVALYAAQAGLPIVCFREAGGIEGFVASGSGKAVEHMNATAMAEAVIDYARDLPGRKAAGAIGQQQVARAHTINTVGPLLLHHMREVMDLAPEISVVVPNYNYEAYLPERLASIAAQTFQDFEVILLDDASPDGSVAVLKDYAAHRPGTRVVVNDSNSGSPFVQWMKGMELAQAPLIWLAEADDRCRPEYLQTMLPFFNDRNTRIAACASQPVTAEGDIIGDYRALYLDRITPGRWDADYVATDHEEAEAGLGIANSIPNASAVMFRKFTPEPEFVKDLTAMRLCGDWYFYCRAMRGGMVGFSAAVLNDHRRHASTVTHQLEGSLRYFTELATVRGYLGRTYRQSRAAQSRISAFLAEDIARFRVEDAANLPKQPTPSKELPSLLVVAPDLGPGGGQVFAISVANEWANRGARVVLLNVGNQPTHPAMLARIAPEVTLLDAATPGNDLGTLIRRFDIDAVHSSIWWADRWVDSQRADLPENMPWVITMHGCHESILAEPDIDPSFWERMGRMTQRARWVYTADKNLKVFGKISNPPDLVHIPNGVSAQPVRLFLSRKDLGLRENAKVLCLASRAIASKGWYEAVRLTTRLNHEGYCVDLLLIGEGPAADAIRKDAPEHVHLVGQVADLQDYFEIVDIGILPSYFVGESLPLVLLEMMARGLPLVASDIGEIPSILGEGEEAAGLLVPRTNDGIDEDALYHAVLSMLDASRRDVFSKAAKQRFNEHFTVTRMVDHYEAMYSAV